MTGPGSSSIVLEEHRWQLYAEMGLRGQENAGAGWSGCGSQGRDG